MALGFVLGFSEDDSLGSRRGLHPLRMQCEFRINLLEYVAAATVMPVMMMGSVEVVQHMSIDNLVRYSRIGCAHVLSY